MYPLKDEAQPEWKASVRPPANHCPRRFCFNFVADGGSFAQGLHDDLESALEKAVLVRGDHCKGTFGRCCRESHDEHHTDWYEPDEPALKAAGLPWFFFIPSSAKVVDEMKAEYLREATALWGHAE
ncbi:MAG: hypothetical protein DI536_19100 [Archangium gephyra]|uniref:Uncharacterized protein n=1 Tax=Archangium gephyra TaxID=48 RepID=A0A2W5TCA2_9BACT|nr:MAG: hypothetical protein DI536_19100 [Archangium gephyra]